MNDFDADSDYRSRFFLVIANIPKGKVTTYGHVAKMAGFPRMARSVGRALKQLPKDSRLPWQRVINAQGRISFPVGSAGYQRQRAKLEAEGIEFIGDKISLAQFGWDGQ